MKITSRIPSIGVSSKRMSVMVDFVKGLATLSKCEDRKVAAIITNGDMSQIYSIGINGGPKGGAQCLCSTGEKYTCAHAEANALVKCSVADNNKVMLCTYSPCVTCATLVVNSGFKAFAYLEKYKNSAGLDILQQAGIRTIYLGGKELGNTNKNK